MALVFANVQVCGKCEHVNLHMHRNERGIAFEREAPEYMGRETYIYIYAVNIIIIIG